MIGCNYILTIVSVCEEISDYFTFQFASVCNQAIQLKVEQLEKGIQMNFKHDKSFFDELF